VQGNAAHGARYTMMAMTLPGAAPPPGSAAQPVRRRVSWTAFALVAVSLLVCCGGLNQWVLTPSTRADVSISRTTAADLVKGREYPVYADAPGVDELRCTVGEDSFQRELVVRRSADPPLFRSNASVDGGGELPFFGWLRSDRSEWTAILCEPDVEYAFVDNPRPLWILAGTTALALGLAVTAVIVVLATRRRRLVDAVRPPSLRWLLVSACLMVAGLAVPAVAAVVYGPWLGGTDQAPDVSAQSPPDGSVSVLTDQLAARYLVYQAYGGSARDCGPLLEPGDPPFGVPARIEHVGVEFRYVGSFVSRTQSTVRIDCEGGAPLLVKADRRPVTVLSLSGSACLVSGVVAVGLAVVLLARRRVVRHRPPGAGPVPAG
jgi:hypothetical protein